MERLDERPPPVERPLHENMYTQHRGTSATSKSGQQTEELETRGCGHGLWVRAGVDCDPHDHLLRPCSRAATMKSVAKMVGIQCIMVPIPKKPPPKKFKAPCGVLYLQKSSKAAKKHPWTNSSTTQQ